MLKKETKSHQIFSVDPYQVLLVDDWILFSNFLNDARKERGYTQLIGNEMVKHTIGVFEKYDMNFIKTRISSYYQYKGSKKI